MDPLVRPPEPEETISHPWTGETIARRLPRDRPGAPPPTKPADMPRSSGWDTWLHEEWNRAPNAPPVDQVWSYDRDEYPSGWLKADSIAAAQMFSAAYDAALHLGERVKRLNMDWHRETEFNIRMYGRGARGDIAPDEVHQALDDIIASRPGSPTYSELELNGLHARIDLIWMRHSRSPARLRVAVRDLRVRDPAFTESETILLVEVLNEHCLVDFHDVMICVDPRATVVYGRTREAEGNVPRWTGLGSSGIPPLQGEWSTLGWEQRSEISGSSRDGSDEDELPYTQSRYQRAVQLFRHAGRDYEKVLVEVERLKKEAKSLRAQAVKLAEEVQRSGNLYNILVDGLSVAPRAEPDPQTPPVF